jgi:hypothetical protein
MKDIKTSHTQLICDVRLSLYLREKFLLHLLFWHFISRHGSNLPPTYGCCCFRDWLGYSSKKRRLIPCASIWRISVIKEANSTMNTVY